MATQAGSTHPAVLEPPAAWEGATGEAQRVLVWRFEQLVAHGYVPVDAVALAGDAGVDLALARSLVARGCPPALAARILA